MSKDWRKVKALLQSFIIKSGFIMTLRELSVTVSKIEFIFTSES